MLPLSLPSLPSLPFFLIPSLSCLPALLLYVLLLSPLSSTSLSSLCVPSLTRHKVGSVEEFQGQEKRVIIISTVRSTREYLESDYAHNLGKLNKKPVNIRIFKFFPSFPRFSTFLEFFSVF
jgi:hypothetical protein